MHDSKSSTYGDQIKAIFSDLLGYNSSRPNHNCLIKNGFQTKPNKKIRLGATRSLGLLEEWAQTNRPRQHLETGARSVAHCYSGCGLGEITGVFVTVGLLALSTWWVAGITFALAYVASFTLTVGPLMQEGVGFGQSMLDAFYSETASITVMEIVAIASDLFLAGSATMFDPLFWASLILSLTAGLAAAYPVNVLLIRMGVKEGMHDPREMASAA